jgi:hypothetical protein
MYFDRDKYQKERKIKELYNYLLIESVPIEDQSTLRYRTTVVRHITAYCFVYTTDILTYLPETFSLFIAAIPLPQNMLTQRYYLPGMTS